MNGGYVMIKASDSNVYDKLKNAINLGKPILYYENDTTCYYIDTITLDGTNIVLTKGGKTITIANDNTITTSGDIQNHLYALMFDESDLSFDDYNVGNSQYFTILTSLDITKLSELERGYYPVFSGTLINNDSKEIEISFIERDADGLNFYLANDNNVSFTISYDNDGQKTQLF